MVRSKGFCWIASRNDRVCLWHHAGRIFSFSFPGTWVAAGTLPPPPYFMPIIGDVWGSGLVGCCTGCKSCAAWTVLTRLVCSYECDLTAPESERTPEMLEAVKSNWDEMFGDRHQEVVIIGVHMDHEQVKSAVNECLLTDEEMAAGPDAWAKYSDPWPASMPDEADHAHSHDDGHDHSHCSHDHHRGAEYISTAKR